MKRLSLLFALIFMGILSVNQASAQTSFFIGPHIGYDLDMEKAFIGADARLTTPSLPVEFNPGAQFYLGLENAGLMRFDLNVLYPFGIDNQTFTPYAGLGASLGVYSIEFGTEKESDSYFGVNLMGGATFGFGRMRPFVEARALIEEGEVIPSIKGGVLFGL